MSNLMLKAGSRPPWVGLSAAVFVQFAAGNTFCFPLFSRTLKLAFGLSQQQISILGVAVDIGENAGVLPGIVCNRFPPWVVLFIGAFSCFWGYGLLSLAVTRTLHNLPYWLLWLALLIASNSCAWFSTAILVTNMRNFPLNRGTVAGLLKGYSGLSAAIYTIIYSMLLNKSSSALLIFLTFGLPIICSSMMYLIRLCAPEIAPDSSHKFLFAQGTSILFGVYLLATTVINTIFPLGKFSYMFVAITVVFMIAPISIPIKMTMFPTCKQLGGSVTEPLLPSYPPSCSDESQDTDIDILLAVGEGAVEKKERKLHRGEDFKFKEALVKADFWLLWLVYFLGSGSGVTVLNNLAQIGYALGNGVDTTILLSLFSFCNFVGRIGGGAVSEYFVRSYSMPRTIWMAFTQAIMVISFMLYASNLSYTLYISTALLGICYGVQFTTMIPTASELFGLKHFGVIYNFILLGNPIGAFLFSGLLAGSLYDVEATKQGVSTCIGIACFRVAFLTLAGVSGVGAILGLFLTLRIRPVYHMISFIDSFKLHQAANH